MTDLLNNEQILALAQENSVRGTLVRQVLERAEGADAKERQLLEQALQLLLSRFQAVERTAP
jgi:RNA polymerase-interacting CarD/CdnL/TRCF family regulator